MRSDCPQLSERTRGVSQGDVQQLTCSSGSLESVLEELLIQPARQSQSYRVFNFGQLEPVTERNLRPTRAGLCAPASAAVVMVGLGWAPAHGVSLCGVCGGAGARSGHCAGLRTEHSPHWHWPRPGWAAAHGTARRSNLPLATVNWGVRRPQHWCSMKNEASGLEYKYYIACYITDWVERKNVVHGGGGIAPKFVLLSIYYKQ